MEEKEETCCGMHARWGQLWDRRKEINLDFSHQLPAPLRVSGLQVSLPFAVSSGTRYRWGKGSMVGPSCPPVALGSH